MSGLTLEVGLLLLLLGMNVRLLVRLSRINDRLSRIERNEPPEEGGI